MNAQSQGNGACLGRSVELGLRKLPTLRAFSDFSVANTQAVGSLRLPLAWASKMAGLPGLRIGGRVEWVFPGHPVFGHQRRTLASTGRVEVECCSCPGVSEDFNPWL